MDIIGKQGDIKCDNHNVSFTIRETENEYIISVLNMNCIDDADEQFTVEFNGTNISGKVAVGEIKDYKIAKA